MDCYNNTAHRNRIKGKKKKMPVTGEANAIQTATTNPYSCTTALG
jgi:hypothetical protein